MTIGSRCDGDLRGRLAGAQTILQALEVIDVLWKAEREAGLTEIARGLCTAHEYRHRTLAGAGCVGLSSDSGRYRLGREAFLLGRAAERDLGSDAVAPLLERLRDGTTA